MEPLRRPPRTPPSGAANTGAGLDRHLARTAIRTLDAILEGKPMTALNEPGINDVSLTKPVIAASRTYVGLRFCVGLIGMLLPLVLLVAHSASRSSPTAGAWGICRGGFLLAQSGYGGWDGSRHRLGADDALAEGKGRRRSVDRAGRVER